MSLLKRVKKSQTASSQERDVLGGRFVFETDVYPVEIKQAFVYETDSGSTGCRIEAVTQDNQDYVTDLWIADKKGNNYYTKDGKQTLLPGYIMLNSLLLLAAGKSLDADEGDDDFEALELTKKTVKMGKDKNQQVEVLDDLTGVNSLFAIQKVRKNKTKKEGNSYVKLPEIVFDNELVKVFSALEESYGYTVSECETDAKEAEFISKWTAKNKGKDRDLYTEVTESTSKSGLGAAKTGIAARKPLSRGTPQSTDDEGNTVGSDDVPDDQEQEEEPVEQKPVRKTFTRPK